MALSKFVKQYELAILDRREEENKEDYVTIYARPVLRLNVKIEKEAAGVYTRSIFCKFQEQLYQGLSYRHRKVEEHGTECVYKNEETEKEQNNQTRTPVAHIQKPLFDPPFVKPKGRPKDFTSFLDKGKNGTKKGSKKNTQTKPNAKKKKTRGKEISDGGATERDSDFHTVSQELMMDTEQQSRYSHDFMLPSFNQESFLVGNNFEIQHDATSTIGIHQLEQGTFEHFFLRPQQSHGIASIDLNNMLQHPDFTLATLTQTALYGMQQVWFESDSLVVVQTIKGLDALAAQASLHSFYIPHLLDQSHLFPGGTLTSNRSSA
ncbi:hypothetical protein IFM89_035054 [Coptis chinensis]|uniref:Protein FAR1-RELATED SEQUENCE n=1 Tax=Coptis chinensis TaxID=261450 RepID=A0A835LGP4_9MAGN|nr:hypothetical protein IFM89_035054 [Coptis chinensis]